MLLIIIFQIIFYFNQIFAIFKIQIYLNFLILYLFLFNQMFVIYKYISIIISNNQKNYIILKIIYF